MVYRTNAFVHFKTIPVHPKRVLFLFRNSLVRRTLQLKIKTHQTFLHSLYLYIDTNIICFKHFVLNVLVL